MPIAHLVAQLTDARNVLLQEAVSLEKALLALNENHHAIEVPMPALAVPAKKPHWSQTPKGRRIMRRNALKGHAAKANAAATAPAPRKKPHWTQTAKGRAFMRKTTKARFHKKASA